MKKMLLLVFVLILGYSSQASQIFKQDDVFVKFTVVDQAGMPLEGVKIRFFTISGIFLGGGETDQNGYYQWNEAVLDCWYIVEFSLIGYTPGVGKCIGGHRYRVKISGTGIVVTPLSPAFSARIVQLSRQVAISDKKISYLDKKIS